MIQHILIIALVTLGYCCVFWQGMIFERIGDWMECNVPEWLWKPLGGCYICACMWIGTVVYWLLYKNSILDWLLTCVGAMGVNAAISQFVDKRHKVEIVNDEDDDQVHHERHIYKPDGSVEIKIDYLKQFPNKKGSEGD